MYTHLDGVCCGKLRAPVVADLLQDGRDDGRADGKTSVFRVGELLED